MGEQDSPDNQDKRPADTVAADTAASLLDFVVRERKSFANIKQQNQLQGLKAYQHQNRLFKSTHKNYGPEDAESPLDNISLEQLLSGLGADTDEAA